MGGRDLLPLVDANTVTMLETLTPKYSTHDAAKVTNLVGEGKAFPAIRDPGIRGGILARLLTIEGRILSIWTYLEDTKCLELLWKILRQLFPNNLKRSKRSMRETFYSSYTGVNQRRGQMKLQYDLSRGWVY